MVATYWANFTKRGDPNGPGVPAWPRFTEKDGKVMYFRDQAQPGPVPSAEALVRSTPTLRGVARQKDRLGRSSTAIAYAEQDGMNRRPMTKIGLFSSRAAAGLLLIALSGCSTTDAPPSTLAVSAETASRTVEDGGTGAYKALMASDRTLPTHTVFRPNDLRAFGRKAKLPIIAGATVPAPIHPGNT